MATRTLFLDCFEKGQLISWFMTSQANNKITVKLYDETTTYVNTSKQSTDIVLVLSEGQATLSGNNLKLEITAEPTTSEPLTWINNISMSFNKSNEYVGKYFVLAGDSKETGNNDDYTDICVSVSGWNKRNRNKSYN